MSMGKQGRGSGSGMSSVGNSQAYETGDQVTVPRGMQEETRDERTHVGHTPGQHLSEEHKKHWGHKHSQSEEKKVSPINLLTYSTSTLEEQLS